jgi:hypothetical protein
MRGIEAARLRKVEEWARYAEEDLRLARHALTLTTGCPFRLIAYHAQQCAEKYLKAFLVAAGVDFPYTHNISRLLEICAESQSWPASIREAEELTPYGPLSGTTVGGHPGGSTPGHLDRRRRAGDAQRGLARAGDSARRHRRASPAGVKRRSRRGLAAGRVSETFRLTRPQTLW